MSQTEKSGAVNPGIDFLREAINLCRRPFTTAAVKWKIQTNPKTDTGKATIVAFIDARLAGERLNAAGLPWSSKYGPVQGGLACEISVTDPETHVTYTRGDVGWSRGTGDNMTLKTLYSDAFKRAAVHFGVGVSIYALPMKKLSAEAGEIKKLGNSWVITYKGKAALDAHYEAWLKEHGIPAFGEPLDHGDREGAQGDVESEDRANDEDVAGSSQPEAKFDPVTHKLEPTEAAKQAAETKLVDEGQVEKIVQALGQSTKSLDDVKTYLASKGVEDTSALEGTLGNLLELQLDYEIGKGLFVWLRRAKKASS